MKTGLTGFILAAALINSAPARAALRVIATTEDLAAIAREIGGERIHVESIFKGVHDPHHLGAYLDERLDRRRALEQADLFISAGPTLEGVSAGDPLEHVSNGNVHPGGAGYLDASRGCRVLEATNAPSRAAGTIHGLGSPHYWLDPDNGAVIAGGIAEKLAQLDPENKQAYAAALDRFRTELDDRKKKWAEAARAVKGFPVVAYRDSWGNLAEWLGLRVVETMEPKPGLAPSKTRIAEANRRIKAEHIGAVLIEPYLDRKAADQAARGTGAQVIVLAPSVGASPDIVAYFDLFDHDLKAVAAVAQASGYRPKD